MENPLYIGIDNKECVNDTDFLKKKRKKLLPLT